MWHCYIVGYSEFVILTALVIKTPYIPNICKAIMVLCLCMANTCTIILIYRFLSPLSMYTACH